jgi:hypothetical protein
MGMVLSTRRRLPVISGYISGYVDMVSARLKR